LWVHCTGTFPFQVVVAFLADAGARDQLAVDAWLASEAVVLVGDAGLAFDAAHYVLHGWYIRK
jgi:hypothetical protein